jgi:myo-inositol catabolism protein IolS
MRYRRVGSAGWRCPRSGWAPGSSVGNGASGSRSPRWTSCGRACERGANLIDTAECYGNHLAESLVGHAIAADRERWVVATKFGRRFDAERMRQPGWDPVGLRSDHWSPGQVVGQLEDSLRALGTDHVDIYQSHGGADADLQTPGLWAALQEQVRAGKIRHLGISLDPDGGARARRAPDVGAEIIQVPYSRLQPDAEEGVLPACAELGLGVLAREPLANGYFSGKYKPGSRITSPNEGRSHHDPREVEAKLEAVARIRATELPLGVPLAQWALTWPLRHPAVSTVIVGCKKIEQLESNIAAADLDLVSDAHPLAVGAMRGTRSQEARR